MTSLKSIRIALQSSGSEHAVYLISLIDSGKLSPYASRPESLVRRRFGSSETSFPRLGKKASSFAVMNSESIQNLKEECLRELKDTRHSLESRQIYVTSSTRREDTGHATDDETAEDTTSTIITDISGLEADLEAAEHVIAFQSGILDTMRYNEFEAPENILHTSMAMFTLLPSNTMIPLQHSNEGTTAATLLSGSVFWIIWPPTKQNLQALQMAYEKFSERFDEAKFEVSWSLEGGIILLQSEGEGLRIPPFCLVISFTTQTSILATYSIVTIDNFVSILPRLSLLEAFFKTELDGKRKQDAFNAEVLRWLGRILNGEIDPETKTLDEAYRLSLADEGPLQTLLRSWDNVKDDIARIMGHKNAKVMQDIWATFLITSKGRQCKLCGKSIQNKQKLMRKHFVANHWPMEKTQERIDSMDLDVTEGDGYARDTA